MIDQTIIRELRIDELVPYELLLLADEEMQAIEQYIYTSEIYVAEANNLIICVYVLCPADEFTVEIKAIAVDKNLQNQGIGKLMLKDAEMKAQKKGYRELIIGTPTIAKKQLAIYEKVGFKLYDVKKDFFINNYSKSIFEDGIQLKAMAMLSKSLLP